MKFKIFAPATIGNVASGFDVLGLAVDQLGDLFHIEKEDRYLIQVSGRDAEAVPLDPEQNTVTIAARSFFKRLGVKEQPFRVHLERSLPLAGGMGSSAASSVAGALAAARLSGALDQRDIILKAALDAEGVVAGRHLDNIAPCYYGGLTLVQDTESLAVYHLPVQADIWVTLATPPIKIRTKDARQVLPADLPSAVWTKQMAACTTLALALSRGDHEQIAFGLTDLFAEPARGQLIPHFFQAQKQALSAGGYGFSISGSGPTCFALSPSKQKAEAIQRAVAEVFGPATSVLVTRVRHQGAEVFDV